MRSFIASEPLTRDSTDRRATRIYRESQERYQGQLSSIEEDQQPLEKKGITESKGEAQKRSIETEFALVTQD